MTDPIASNEAVRAAMDAYRVFSQELTLIGQQKTALVKSIIARLDAERLEQARKNINSLAYERQS